MATDQRDQLWEAAYESYYDAYYLELVADLLINRWQWFDEATKVLVAATASGSAISGWALWSRPELKIIWVCLAGVAAVLGLVHTSLGVPDRLKDHGEIKRRFMSLRADLETFRYRMRIDSNFPIDSFTQEFVEYRKRFASDIQLLKNDILKRRGLENRAQTMLNTRLANERKESA